MNQSGSFNFDTKIVRLDGEIVVVAAGEIDVGSSEAFMSCFLEAAEDASHLILDHSQDTFMDSAGLTALVVAQHRLRNGYGWLMLRAPQRRVRKVIGCAGLEATLPVERDNRRELV